MSCQSFNPKNAVTSLVWAAPRSLTTTCGITIVFFSYGYLDVSVPHVRLPVNRNIQVCTWMGCPIRTSPDQRLFAPPRSFSQLVTSFFASESQGIHHSLLLIFIVTFRTRFLCHRNAPKCESTSGRMQYAPTLSSLYVYLPSMSKIVMLAFGLWPLAFGFWLLAFGLWLLALGLWPLAFGLWLLAFGLWLLALGLWPLAFGFWPLALGFWPLAFGSWLLALGFCQQLTANSQ
jgi:hypothetical protein